MTGIPGVIRVICPNPKCKMQLVFSSHEASVECTGCGQRHTQSGLCSLGPAERYELEFERFLYELQKESQHTTKLTQESKVHGLSNYLCTILSPLLTMYGMDRTTGKAKLLTEMGKSPIFDCAQLGDRAFLIDPDHLAVPGYGRDRTGSHSYLQDTLHHIKVINENEERLVPIHADGDGHCLVHAVSRALVGWELFWHPLRVNLKQHFIENIHKYKVQFQDFIDEIEWDLIIEECDPDFAPKGAEPTGLQNIHIFGLANVLKRPIVLLDSLEGIQSPGDYSAIFLPCFSLPSECMNKEGVLNKPICIAWSSLARNHFIPLVGVKGRKCPVLSRHMIYRAWGIADSEIKKYVSFDSQGNFQIAGDKVLQITYVQRLVAAMSDVFFQQHEISPSLFADVYQQIFKANGLMFGMNVKFLLEKTRSCIMDKLLHFCLSCWSLSLVVGVQESSLLPGGELYNLAVACHGNLKDGQPYSFPIHDVVAEYSASQDKLIVIKSPSTCNHCRNKQLRIVHADYTVEYKNGDRTLTHSSKSLSGFKHFWNGREYDIIPKHTNELPCRLHYEGVSGPSGARKAVKHIITKDRSPEYKRIKINTDSKIFNAENCGASHDAQLPPVSDFTFKFSLPPARPPTKPNDNHSHPTGPCQGTPPWPQGSHEIDGISNKVPDHVNICFIDNYKPIVQVTVSTNQRDSYLNFCYPDDARDALAKGIKFQFDRELKINPVYTGQNLSPNSNISPCIPSVTASELRVSSDHFYSWCTPAPHDRRSPPPGGFYELRNEHRPGPSSTGGQSSHEDDRKGKQCPYNLDHVDLEYDDKATRTLFVKNLDRAITDYDLKNIFGKFGLLEDVVIEPPFPYSELKKAIIEYINLDYAHKAKVEMSGKNIGRFKCNISYGKVTPTKVIWVGGLGPWVTLQTLEHEFNRFGAIQNIEWPKNKNFAYVTYYSIDAAQTAWEQMRGFPLCGSDRRLSLDFGDKNHIIQSYSLPDHHYPPPIDDTPLPDQPSGPRKGSSPDVSDRCFDDCVRVQINYRLPPADTFTDTTHSHDDPERCRERKPEYSKSYVEQQSPETSTDYKNVSAKTGENARNVTERRDYRVADSEADYMKQCRTLSDLSESLPIAWNGALILSSSCFATSMYVISGNETLVHTLMRDPTSTESPVLKITSHVHLDQLKLDDIARRIQAAGQRSHCILLAVPSSLSNYEDNGAAIQQHPLKNLVTDLKQKEAAGIISLPQFPFQGKEDVYIMYAFPPCDFGFSCLKIRASKLLPDTTKEDYLVMVIVHSSA